MEIDARGLTHPEPLLRLREAVRDDASLGEPIVILVDSKEEAARVRAFAKLSHFPLEIEKREDHYRMSIDRMCNCG